MLQSEIDSFGDVPVTLEIQMGHRTGSVRELASLGAGDIVPLNEAAGKSMCLYAGNVRLAFVEIVVIDDRLAVRITDFDAPAAEASSIPEEKANA